MALAGELEIRMFAELARLRDDMSKATGIVTRSTKNIESAAALATRALGVLGIGISVVGFANLIKGSIGAMDHLQDLSKTTTLTVETLAGLRIAAKQSGSDLDSTAASINKLSVEVGKAPEKFKALGISATDPLEQFKQLADISNTLTDVNQRNAVLAAALGKAWQGAVPLLAEGSKRIGEMVEAGTKASGITGDMARQSDLLNDKWALLWGSGGMVNSIVGKMIPTFLRLTDQLIEAKEASSGFWEAFWQFSTTGGGNDVLGKWLGLVKDLDALKSGYERSPSSFETAKRGTTPGIDAKAAKFLGSAADAEREHAKAIRDKMAWLAAGAESQERYNQAILDAIEAGDKEVARIRESALAMEDMIAELGFMNDRDRGATIEKKRAAQETGLETLRANLMTEDELRKFAYEADFNLLNDTLGMKKEAQEEYYTLMGRLVRQNIENQTSIEDAAIKKRFGIANVYRKLDLDSAGFFADQMAGLMTTKSRELFEIGKAAAIAGAIVDTYKAATGAYAALASIPVVGPALGAAAATAAVLVGMARVQAISSTTMGGGGAAGTFSASPTTGLPESPSAGTASGGGTTTIINLQGDSFSRKGVQDLIEQINEQTKDGGRLILA